MTVLVLETVTFIKCKIIMNKETPWRSTSKKTKQGKTSQKKKMNIT